MRTNKRKVVLVFLLFDIVFGYLYFSATSLVFSYGGESFKSQISTCSYHALENCVKDNYDFSKICIIEKNVNGEVVLIQTNTLLVNEIVKELSIKCSEYMQDLLSKGVKVPLGAFSGIKLFSGFGKKVNVKITYTLSVECKILRSFESAGINQTRQVLSAEIYTDLKIFAPLFKRDYCGGVNVLLYDNLIIGKVPEVYLNSALLGQITTQN